MHSTRSLSDGSDAACVLAVMVALCGCASSPTPAAPLADGLVPSASRTLDEGTVVADRMKRAAECERRQQAIAVQLFTLNEVDHDAADRGRERFDQRLRLETASRALLDRARSEYVSVLENPAASSTERQEATWLLAQNRIRVGDRAAASHWLATHATTYPDGRHAAEVQAALAQIAFAESRLAETVAHCDAALTGLAGDRRVAVLYLKAWSLRGLEAERPSAPLEALDALSEIVALQSGSRTPGMFAETAEREIVALYRKTGPAADERLLQRLGPERTSKLRAVIDAERSKPRPQRPTSL